MKTLDSVRSTERHLGFVDALRGIAIVGVLLVHCAIATKQTGFLYNLAFTGQRGVQLFYVVSAFTLCLSLDERREHHPLGNFLLRRFFRIAPLFYLAIVANVLLRYFAPLRSSLGDLSHGEILLGFLFLNGASPRAINNVVGGGWSIAVETTFYLVLPWLHRRITTVRQAILFFVISAPALACFSWGLMLKYAGRVHNGIDYFAFLWFPIELPVFALGILAYRIWRQHIDGAIKGSSGQKYLSLLLLASSAAMYYACLPFNDLNLYFSSFLFLPLILALSIHAWPVLVNRFTRFVGKISYSLYLIHFFVLSALSAAMERIDKYPGHLITRYVMHRGAALGPFFLLLFGLSVLICMLTWKFIEQPGMRLGRRFIARREGRAGRLSGIPLIPPLRALESAGSTGDAQL